MKFLRIFFPLRCGIRYVINVTSDLPNYFECDAKDGELNGGNGLSDITYMRIPVDDNCSHNLAQFFPGILDFLSYKVVSSISNSLGQTNYVRNFLKRFLFLIKKFQKRSHLSNMRVLKKQAFLSTAGLVSGYFIFILIITY